MKKTKILMVCLGNICRSPLAEGVMRSKLPVDSFEVDSAGKKHGVDISMLKGRQFSITDFEAFDYIFVMDRSNYQHLIRLARNEHDLNKISFLGDALGKVAKAEIPDPYYGSEADFEKVYQLIDAACDNVAHKLTTNS